MRYLLLIAGDENRLNHQPEAEQAQTMEAWGAFTHALQESGKLRGGERLRPAATATTVRVKGGERLLSDGPFAETKEQLGGFYLVEADNLDEAIDFAARIPAARTGGAIEVRPVIEH